MTYVDGFVVAVPAANREAYIAYAASVVDMFKEAGVLRFVECWGDDVPEGKVTDFRRAVQATPEEVVVFSWLEWPSKEARDAGMAKIMADDRMRDMPMPFDGKRMIFGGFRPVIDV